MLCFLKLNSLLSIPCGQYLTVVTLGYSVSVPLTTINWMFVETQEEFVVSIEPGILCLSVSSQLAIRYLALKQGLKLFVLLKQHSVLFVLWALLLITFSWLHLERSSQGTILGQGPLLQDLILMLKETYLGNKGVAVNIAGQVMFLQVFWDDRIVPSDIWVHSFASSLESSHISLTLQSPADLTACFSVMK